MNIFEKIGVKYPIICGGMANIGEHKLAAAVSNAGGLGLIASGGHDAEYIREEIKKCRALTDKPFGVNIMLMSPHKEAICKMVAEEKVAVVTTGAGSPGQYIPMWKEAGIIVIPVVGGVALAKRMESAGADAIISEGMEAGGHISELTTMANLPQVVEAVNIDVIAAGGIASGRQIVASYALGAVGVQVGTAFLVAEECIIHDNYKQKLVKAKDSSTTVTGRETGAPVRVIKNKMSKEYTRIIKEGIELEKLEELTLGSLRKAVYDGDMDMGSVMAGQTAGMLKEVKPAAKIIEDMFNEADAVLKNLKVK